MFDVKDPGSNRQTGTVSTMAQIDRIAAQGFSRGAADYEAARPGYPPGVIRLLVEEFQIDPSSHLLDLAAGTGKLTRALLPTGADVVAVEPIPEMREQLESTVPQADVLEGTAEAIPLDDGAVDAVVVGQAFHWFQPQEALDEIHRVLRPGGGLALVYNVRDRSVAWVSALYEVIDRYRGHLPHGSKGRWREVLEGDERFLALRQEEFDHQQEISPEEVERQIASISYVSVLPDKEREAALAEVRHILETHEQTKGRNRMMMPFRTEVFWTFKT